MNGTEEENYASSPVGNLIQWTFWIDDKPLLKTGKGLEKHVEDALVADEFTLVRDDNGKPKKTCHQFLPQGYTWMHALSESHLAAHTYPEHGSVTVTLYTCRGIEDGRKVLYNLAERLNPRMVEIRETPVVAGVQGLRTTWSGYFYRFFANYDAGPPKKKGGFVCERMLSDCDEEIKKLLKQRTKKIFESAPAGF